jgi:hypothetical protein
MDSNSFLHQQVEHTPDLHRIRFKFYFSPAGALKLKRDKKTRNPKKTLKGTQTKQKKIPKPEEKPNENLKKIQKKYIYKI